MTVSDLFDIILVPTLIAVGVIMRRSSGVKNFRFGQVVCGSGVGDKKGGRAALMTSLAATVGTANIAGAAGAVIMGGPGALAWIWLCGLLGMGIKYSEAVLAVKYSVDEENGSHFGGPMHCMEKTMGKRGKNFGKLYSASGVFAALLTGALWQTSAAANMLLDTVKVLLPRFGSASALRMTLGIAAAALALTVLLGGGTRTMRISEKTVPFMCVGYAAAALGVIFANLDRLPSVLFKVLRGVLDPKAVTGGILSGGMSAVFSTAAIGLQTGTFSGEAGLGSAGISYAAGLEREPVKAGFCGVIEVFIDTMVICTLTALAVLCSGTMNYGSDSPTEAVLNAFASVFGRAGAGLMLSISVMMFALSSVFTWSWYGASCTHYLTVRPAYESVYQIAFTLAVFLGAFINTSTLTGFISVSNTLLILPNSFLLFSERGTVARETARYLKEALFHKTETRKDLAKDGAYLEILSKKS